MLGSLKEKLNALAKQACAGAPGPQCELGSFFEQTEKFADAAKWYLLSAQQNYAPAQTSLAFLYLQGKPGVPKNEPLARKWMLRAAAQHYPNAECAVGWWCGHAECGMELDYGKAYQYYQSAAKQNDSEALNNLGELYADGHGVPQNWMQAEVFFRMALLQGQNASAAYNLGVMYAEGREHLKPNMQKAMLLLSLARENAVVGQIEFMNKLDLLDRKEYQMEKIIPKNKISIDYLNELLSLCFETEVDREAARIRLLNSRIALSLFEKQGCISLRSFFRVVPNVPKEKIYEILNMLNMTYFICRLFYIENPNANIIVCDYDMDYKYGIIPAELTGAVRRFNEIAGECLDCLRQAEVCDEFSNNF